MAPLYLDNNATTQPDPEVSKAVSHALAELWANPSSIHRPGQSARRKIELARKTLAALIGARPRTLTLTGSGTEAINLAIRGCLKAQGHLGRAAARAQHREVSIVTTRAEHSAVRECAIDLERTEAVRIHWAPLTPEGLINLGSLRAILESDPSIALVSIQWANNETGAIQPVGEIGAMCRARGILYHCDATQMVGKEGIEASRHHGIKAQSPDASVPSSSRLDASMPGCFDAFDLLNFSPHKFHGPKGVGVLYVRPGVHIAPILPGEQELGKRAGTENTPAIIGAGVAAELAHAWVADPANIARGRALRDRFESLILSRIPESRLNGPRDPAKRLWNTSSIAFPDTEAEPLLFMLSERGLCASAGAACSSGSLEPSSVLLATGIPPDLANATLRFSLSRYTTPEEIDQAADLVTDCVHQLRQSAAVP